MSEKKLAMRDVLIEGINERMHDNSDIFFLSADFGSPKLDRLREEFPKRFINVGIAEQNLINVATGLALEGYTVYAYAIAPFITMRAYEQIRVNLSLHSHLKEVNVNMIGVGAGLSYDVSGPTHHCLEDISIMRTLPNIEVFSPSDYVMTEKFIEYSLHNKSPKYIRFDSKPVVSLYDSSSAVAVEDCFCELVEGHELCIVSTGFMSHTACQAAAMMEKRGCRVGVIDVFLMKPFKSEAFYNFLSKYKAVITIEEGFIHKNGLDSLVQDILNDKRSPIPIEKMGFGDRFVFDLGGRECLHRINGVDAESVVGRIEKMLGDTATRGACDDSN